MPSNVYFFQGFSLVDITSTGVSRGMDDTLERNQQRNWETVLQCIGLRTQPHYVQEPVQSTFSDISKPSLAISTQANNVFGIGNGQSKAKAFMI